MNLNDFSTIIVYERKDDKITSFKTNPLDLFNLNRDFNKSFIEFMITYGKEYTNHDGTRWSFDVED